MATTVHSERVWKIEFLNHFQRFLGDTWFLCKCNERDPIPERWRRFRDSAKVRFCCETCSNGWTSMKGRVVFWFYLDYRTRVGYCLFKLYGQKCKKCNKTNVFEAPMWYPEEINKVMFNVYNRIGEVYYHFTKTTLVVDRRDGRPRLQHNRDLCQACQTGECWNGPGDIINAEGQHVSQKASDESGIGSPGASFDTNSSEKDSAATEDSSLKSNEDAKTSQDSRKPSQTIKQTTLAEDENTKTSKKFPKTVPGSRDFPMFASKPDFIPIPSPKEFHPNTFNFIAPPPFLPNTGLGFPLMSPQSMPQFPNQIPNFNSRDQMKNPPLYINPMAGPNGNKTGVPPMEISPTWAQFNLLQAMNRMYIS